MPDALSIAGVRFRLLGSCPAGSLDFSPPFQVFLNAPETADLACDVVCLGPDPALAALPPDPNLPWSFAASPDGIHTLTRRDAEGVVLWRIRATRSCDRAELSWHPVRFEPVYGSYARSWDSGLGLTLLVFRLRAHGGLVFHGSTAQLDGRGVLCAGVSGSGKSTIARLLAAAGASVLTDERPVVRQHAPPPAAPDAAPVFRVHGSPWPSAAGFAHRADAPLRRIYFLEHGDSDRLTPLSPPEAFRRLIQVATIPWHDEAFFDPCLATVDTLLRSVPCAVLAFRPTAAVVDLIRHDLHRFPGGLDT